ncbi:MAG: hypothetical protein HDR23_10575 [Lachnospiraceae bacterium]|nr:hypothetical protein [Lachnospiraceae bacterium]MBD5456884.1 hypothetical protein [Lachnospiraceae bacterium]
MARDEKIWEYTRQAGYDPLEDRCIIVKYAPENLSEKITAFFNWEFYALQLCEHEVILLPFDPMWTSLRKDVSLILPYGNIQSVELKDDMLNTVIVIRTGEDEIRLTTQQKELSDLRISGLYATQYAGGFKNWHKENLDGTLKALSELGEKK